MAEQKLMSSDTQQLLQAAQTVENVIVIPEFKMGRNFEGKKGPIEQDMLASDRLVVCLYFAASFCHPCKAFTPKLIEFYNEVNTEEKLLEIILVPFDKTEDDCKKLFRTMPWVSLPFDRERIESYRNNYVVRGIPQLVVLDREGATLVHDAGSEVISRGEDAFLDWVQRAEKRAAEPKEKVPEKEAEKVE